MEALGLLEEIYNNMPDDIIKKLEDSSNPMQINDCDYIDLRYKSEDGVSEEDFKAWYENFKDVLKWIEDNAYRVNSEVV